MRISRLFLDEPLQTHLSNQTPAILEGDRAHYLRNVLRLKTGDEVDLFNGDGGEFRGVIQRVDKKTVEVMLKTYNSQNRVPTVQVHVGLCIIKRDAMDFAIQKLTEIGVAHIHPLVSERVSVSGKQYANRLSHWQSVAISACEQCGMNLLPTLHEPSTLDDWIHQAGKTRYCALPGGRKVAKVPLTDEAEVNLLVGPEGGFSDQEVVMMTSAGFEGIDLGARILRAETAAISLATLATYDVS